VALPLGWGRGIQDEQFEDVLARYYGLGQPGDEEDEYFIQARAYSRRVRGYTSRAVEYLRGERAGQPAAVPSQYSFDFSMVHPLELTEEHHDGRRELALFDRRYGILPDADGAGALAYAAICLDAGFAMRKVKGRDGNMYVCPMEASDGSGLPRTQVADVVLRYGLAAPSVKRDSSPLADRHDKWSSPDPSRRGPGPEEWEIMVEQALLELKCGFSLIIRATSHGGRAMKEAIKRSGVETGTCSKNRNVVRYRRRGSSGPWQYVYYDSHFQTLDISSDGGPAEALANASRYDAVVLAVRTSPLCQGEGREHLGSFSMSRGLISLWCIPYQRSSRCLRST
jgi:hypothetical protein